MNTSDTRSFDIEDFQQDVIEESYEQPVLVDFWAPWCGPCRVLSPVLERIACEPSTKWKLAKVNTEVHPDIARRYGVRGIPNVKLFVDGTVVDEFTGALPEHALRRWLEEALPTRSRTLLEQAQALIDEGDSESAEPLLREILEEDPESDDARLLLARVRVVDDIEDAKRLVEKASISAPHHAQISEAVDTVARLMHLKAHPEDLPEADEKPLYLKAIHALSKHNFDKALEHFIAVLQRNRDYDDDGARKACVALFTLLGEQHPAVKAHRRAFDMSLY